jgi:hypothetical protein
MQLRDRRAAGREAPRSRRTPRAGGPAARVGSRSRGPRPRRSANPARPRRAGLSREGAGGRAGGEPATLPQALPARPPTRPQRSRPRAWRCEGLRPRRRRPVPDPPGQRSRGSRAENGRLPARPPTGAPEGNGRRRRRPRPGPRGHPRTRLLPSRERVARSPSARSNPRRLASLRPADRRRGAACRMSVRATASRGRRGVPSRTARLPWREVRSRRAQPSAAPWPRSGRRSACRPSAPARGARRPGRRGVSDGRRWLHRRALRRQRRRQRSPWKHQSTGGSPRPRRGPGLRRWRPGASSRTGSRRPWTWPGASGSGTGIASS